MNMTPEQLAKLKAMVAQRGQAPQGAIQQAQGAPMPQGPMGGPQKAQAKKAIMDKVSALPPESQKIFMQKIKELAAKTKK